MNNWPSQKELNKFYGNPDKDKNGQPDRDWENANLINIAPPYQLYYPTETNGRLVKRAIKLKTLRVNKKCADSLVLCLQNVGEAFNEAERIKYELDICGGVYNFRLMRNGRALSMHSWGCAIDLSHLINRYKRRYTGGLMMPMKVVEIFKAEGWVWGGRWQTADAQHFQAAIV